ncbi:MAG: hypothetical protein AB1414_07510 [bacterium]
MAIYDYYLKKKLVVCFLGLCLSFFVSCVASLDNAYTSTYTTTTIAIIEIGKKDKQLGVVYRSEGGREWFTDFEVDSEGNLYFFDKVNGWIKKFAPDGRFLMKIGRKGKDKGKIRGWTSFIVDKDQNIYVEFPYVEKHRQIVKFSKEGRPTKKILLQIKRIHVIGFAVDEKGNFYLEDDLIRKSDPLKFYSKGDVKKDLYIKSSVDRHVYFSTHGRYRHIIGNADNPCGWLYDIKTKKKIAIPDGCGETFIIGMDKKGNIYLSGTKYPRQGYTPREKRLYQQLVDILGTEPIEGGMNKVWRISEEGKITGEITEMWYGRIDSKVDINGNVYVVIIDDSPDLIQPERVRIVKCTFLE